MDDNIFVWDSVVFKTSFNHKVKPSLNVFIINVLCAERCRVYPKLKHFPFLTGGFLWVVFCQGFYECGSSLLFGRLHIIKECSSGSD